jgi:hypothetical protein
MKKQALRYVQNELTTINALLSEAGSQTDKLSRTIEDLKIRITPFATWFLISLQGPPISQNRLSRLMAPVHYVGRKSHPGVDRLQISADLPKGFNVRSEADSLGGKRFLPETLFIELAFWGDWKANLHFRSKNLAAIGRE